MNKSVIKTLIEKLQVEYDNAKSVESKSILAYLISTLKTNYLIKEKDLLEKFYIKGIINGIDGNVLLSFDDVYNKENL
jgi:hypothetical protein